MLKPAKITRCFAHGCQSRERALTEDAETGTVIGVGEPPADNGQQIHVNSDQYRRWF